MAVTVEPGQPALGQLRGAGGIDISQGFSGQVGGADLAGGIADTQSLFDAFPAGLGESFVGDEQQPPDPIKRGRLCGLDS